MERKNSTLLKALKDVVYHMGGAKRVAATLWPEKKISSAHALLLACLDANRREKLGSEDLIAIIRLGRDAGLHSAMDAFAEQAGYSRPSPITRDEERAELERRFLHALDQSKQMLDQLEGIQGRLKLGGKDK